MIDTGDGKVWLNNPISLYPVQSYIYANKTDEGLSIPSGQLVLDYADEYEEVKLYVMKTGSGKAPTKISVLACVAGMRSITNMPGTDMAIFLLFTNL